MSDTDPASPSPRFTNALINETSPYLLQHAHNPVDWYAWGSAAFDAARQTGKPILVSIGYSTCYWCHVMERESFEDESTADLMNDRFICIKVDREEHPDVDDLYMTATTIITGSGGWPMNVFLTPPPPPLSSPADNPAWIGLQPFYAGTYFPPDSGYGRPAWKEVLVAVSDAWRNRRADVLAQAGQVASDVRRQLAPDDSPSPVGVGQLGSAVSTLLRIADKTHGGFGTAPKFPQPVYLEFLLDVRDFVDDAAGHRTALQAACRLTLDRMAMGGMYDQVGGGFHRYSTDPLWLVPHFEKMLYDNGQLASLYARASHLYGDPFYARIASEISTYVLREMTDPSTGAFFSAQDAEVDRREGLNYLWLIAELRSTMAAAGRADLVEFAAFVFNLDAGENFQDPHHPSEPRRNVLCLPARPEQLARESNRSLDAFNADLAEVRRILYDARRLRKQPMRDDKVLAAWNGLMIAGLADSARFLHREDFLEAAERAWDFVNTSMRAPDGTLCRSWRSGLPRIEAGADDYAALIHGLLALAQARASNPAARDAHLADARRLAEEARLLFWDDDRGGYFDARSGRADLFLRARSLHDGAIPCANSLMLNNLIRLSELIEPDSPRSVAWRTAFLDDAFRTMESMSARIADNPLSTINATRALFHLLRLAPDRVAGLGASPAVSHQADAPSTADPLAISLSTESLDLSVSARAEVEITLSIAPGHHVAAPISSLPGRQPQEEPAFLVPLSLSLDNAPDFLTLIVDMPPARPLEMAGERIGIYSDKVTIRATLIRRGGDNRVNVTQDPRLILTCQVCTDNACLAPVNLTLPLNIILP